MDGVFCSAKATIQAQFQNGTTENTFQPEIKKKNTLIPDQSNKIK